MSKQKKNIKQQRKNKKTQLKKELYKKTNKKIKKGNILLLLSLIIFAIVFFLLFTKPEKESYTSTFEIKFIASNNNYTNLYNSELIKVDTIYRGEEVKVFNNELVDDNNNTYIKIKYNNKNYYIKKDNLTDNKELVVKEDIIYVKTPTTVYFNVDQGLIGGLVTKGIALEVLGYDKLIENGIVNCYKVRYNDDIGYVYSKYVELTKDRALKHYEPDLYYNIHNDRGNRYNGGYAGHLDYYPVIKPKFNNNIMSSEVKALYLNNSPYIISNIDEYINYAKTTNINAFVVDIKDNEMPGYKSEIFEQRSPTSYKYANNSFEKYKAAINKIKESGFYVIGRITVFKDKYYVIDNSDIAIIDTRTNEPFLHSDTYWPSPYQRKVWQYNVDLAKEAVIEMGFNEIQFDYIRFPDRTIDYEEEGLMDFRNIYEEEKAQVIQRFLQYACDELHKLEVYVSADVFGESAYNYVTAYGQYWPAISNIVDVISGMPYPDHFGRHEFEFEEKVWTTPYKLLNYWASEHVVKRQNEIPTPAIVRNWIQAYDCWDGFKYNDEQIMNEIEALYDAGLDAGYMTWLSTSNINRYKEQINIYSREY